MNRGASQTGIEEVQRLLIASALPLIVTACGIAYDRDARAYSACLVRHAQDPLVCVDRYKRTRSTPPIFRQKRRLQPCPPVQIRTAISMDAKQDTLTGRRISLT